MKEPADIINVNVEARLGVLDRILALVTGVIYAQIEVSCEREPGRRNATTHLWARRLRFRKQTGGGYSELGKEELKPRPKP